MWIGTAVVIVPLVILLLLQYWWLVDLERTSGIARAASFRKYVEGVVKQVHWFYVKNAERALNLPPSYFDSERIPKIAFHFKKMDVEGAKRLFVVSYRNHGSIWVYDPKHVEMVKPEYSNEVLAIWAATSPWSVLYKKRAHLETSVMKVDERDPHHRMILSPITDEDATLVGLAGMILDQEVLETQVLPKAIQASVPNFGEAKGLAVSVRDHDGHCVLAVGDEGCEGKDAVRRSLSFVFTDWTVGLRPTQVTPERWARTNFVYNMSVSVALAVFLVAGIVLALRSASNQMRLSEMKSDFVSNVSHELRTPLSSIRVFGEFMRRGRVQDPAKVREYGGYIEIESRRLTQLINNILDFSRIESGRKVYSFERADLEEVVTGTLATFSVRLRDSGFDIHFHGPDEPLPELDIDPGAMDRAVANLLDNAVKYSNGGKTIEVALAGAHDEVRLSVTDHGIGIAREEQERIFERFHRVSTGLVHDVKGVGLGLSLVLHIVEAHGGRVTVDSQLGGGSTFTIHLPVPPAVEGG